MAWLRLVIVVLLTVLAAAASPGADDGAEADYMGGTVGAIRPGTGGRALTTDPDAFVFSAKGITVRIPYEQINLIEYGQKVDRRLAEAILISPLMILSKKRQHYLTVGFETETGGQQAMLFKVGKKDIRAMLVSLEARTGRRVTYQDEEARKAGKG